MSEDPPHDENCKWESDGKPCRSFSTDGTRMGALVAHTMGTTDDRKIIEGARTDARQMAMDSLTGMDEEQAEWEADQ